MSFQVIHDFFENSPRSVGITEISTDSDNLEVLRFAPTSQRQAPLGLATNHQLLVPVKIKLSLKLFITIICDKLSYISNLMGKYALWVLQYVPAIEEKGKYLSYEIVNHELWVFIRRSVRNVKASFCDFYKTERSY